MAVDEVENWYIINCMKTKKEHNHLHFSWQNIYEKVVKYTNICKYTEKKKVEYAI